MLSDRQATWNNQLDGGDVARQIANGEAVKFIDPKSDPQLIMQMFATLTTTQTFESMKRRGGGVMVRGKMVRYVKS